MVISCPKIMRVGPSPDCSGRRRNSPSASDYCIYASKGKCYALVYAATENVIDDEQFLAVFVLKEKIWVETNRIEFLQPVHYSLKFRMKFLSPDKAGNEGCCYYLHYILSTKEFGVDGIVHAPAISNYLHGVRVVEHAYSYGAQIEEGMPPSKVYGENIGHAWPDGLKPLKSILERKVDRLMEMDR